MIVTHMNPNVLFDMGVSRCLSVMHRHPITSSEVLRSVNIWGETVNDAMEATGMAKNGTEVTVARLPMCDFCKNLDGESLRIEAHYDAKTTFGPWADLCEMHWEDNTTRRLGVGFGQRLVLKS